MRVDALARWVKERGLDALVVENPADLFYLTSIWFSMARLIVKSGESILLVDGRYYEQAKRSVSCCTVELAGKDSFSAALKDAEKVGFDSAFATFARWEGMQRAAGGKEWIAIFKPLKEFRGRKDAAEIAALKKAASLTWQGYRMILRKIRAGAVEKDLAWEFEKFCRENGASGLSFEPIVAFGENSAYPHHRAGTDRLKENQAVLIDVGAAVEHYRGDMTRVFFFGEPDPDLERFYRLVISAHDQALEAVRPGVKLGDLDRVVHSYFAQEGVDHLFTHGLGHGLGIETHEYPIVRCGGEDENACLEPGMVFTIEPGLYLPGTGGVRYENAILVTEDGGEILYDGL